MVFASEGREDLVDLTGVVEDNVRLERILYV